MTRAIRKSDLPTKICPVCQRPFAWRKKWQRTWDDVRYCSDRCRSEAHRHVRATDRVHAPDADDSDRAIKGSRT